MKYLIVSVFAVFMLYGHTVTGQENVVKASLTGALLGDISIGAEHRLTAKSSIQFRAGYLDPAMSLVFREKAFTPRAYHLLRSSGGISTSVEYRFYLSKKSGLQGFYIAPYLRYFNQRMLFDDEVEGYIFSVDTKISSIGAGGQIGYQWLFKEFIALDLYFFGTGIDYHKAELMYQLEPQPPGFDYSMVTPHVDDVFEDIGYLNRRLTHKVNEDNHTSELPFLFPAFRAGISIGVAF